MKKILFVCDPARHANLEIMRGMTATMDGRDDHVVRFFPWTRETPDLARRLWRMKPDAVVLHAAAQPLAAQLLRRGVPCLAVVEDLLGNLPVPVLRSDEEAVSRMAARYFLDRGFKHFAFVGYAWATHMRERWLGYVAELQTEGQRSEAYHAETPPGSLDTDGHYHPPADLVLWLRRRPKPCALLAGCDAIASVILEVCATEKIAVPAELAVMGVDDHTVLCRAFRPNLTSIRQAFFEMGREAVNLIRAWDPQRSQCRNEIKFRPVEVVERESTRTFEVTDPLVLQALAFIAQNSERSFPMTELRQFTGASAKELADRFHAALGRTPVAEVRAQRIARGKRLLAETALPVPQIAKQCCFNSAVYFFTTFKKFTGMTPAEYRRLSAAP